ncbi:MAG: hypothetical protein SFU25_12085 [Candidatus Caenarcaniphilales bacterium]|nr:hypothetical protein [Candidatus Caenarcaniphilales bacterium]
MPFGPCVASFPNARIYPPPAVVSAETDDLTVQIAGAGGSPNGNTVVHVAEPARVYLTLTNESLTDALRYGYVDDVNLNVNGFYLAPGKAVTITSPQEIFAVALGAAPIQTSWDQGIG